MLIDNRVFDSYTMEFNSPLTDEDWEKLEDVDFDHTEHVWFHTKNGKEVHFYKNAIPIEFLEKWFGDNYNALTDLEIAWEKENEKG